MALTKVTHHLVDGIEAGADVTDSTNVASAMSGFPTGTDAVGTDLIAYYDESSSNWELGTISNVALQGPAGAAGSDGADGSDGSTGSTGATGPAGSPDTAAQVLTKVKTVDGSGSGLDADLLDGQHGSYYLPTTGKAADSNLLDGIDSTGFVKQLSDSSSGPNYFTPSSRRVDPDAANPTFAHHAIITFGNGGNVTGQLATHLASGQAYTRGYNSSWSAWRTQWDNLNDGSGSGLDADLLDGIQGSGYVNTTGSQNIDGIKVFTGTNVTLDNPVNSWKYIRLQSSGSAKWDIATKENETSGALQFRAGGGSANTAYVTTAGNYASDTQGTLWGSSNDGSGSGLDADLLDGQHGSYYASASSLSGYLPLTGGTVSGTTSFSYLQNTAGSKLEVMGGADGNQNGIYMWNSTDSNWGIYMAQAGANKSLSGGTACNSLDGRSLHHIRFRCYGSDSFRGWIFENNAEAAKVSITSDTGKIYSTGDHYVGSNVVWHAGCLLYTSDAADE